MNKTLTQLKKISTALVGLLFIAASANAQVVYTDLNPDVTKTLTSDGTEIYYLDMNNDGIQDFSVYVMKFTDWEVPNGGGIIETGFTIGITGVQETSLIASDVPEDGSEVGNAISLNSGDDVKVNGYWENDPLLYYDITSKFNETPFAFSGGNFKNSSGKFLGVKFLDDHDNTLYGYIGIDVAKSSFTIRGYAYEKTIDATIAAGANATTGLSSYVESNTTIKNYNNAIVAEFANSFNGKMEVVNINGQIVKSTPINGLASSVSMDDAPSGVYQVVVSGVEGFATEKVFITNR